MYMYIVGANEQGITDLEEIYFRAPLIFPSASDNLALFVRALSPKRMMLASLATRDDTHTQTKRTTHRDILEIMCRT